MARETAEAKIENLYRTYVETFNRGDAAGIAQLFSFPAMMGGHGHPPMAVPDAATYVRMIEGTLDQFRSRGWARTEIDRLQTVVTAGGTAFLVTDFTRYRGDGSVLDGGSATYVMLCSEGRWSIIAAMG